MSDFAANQQCSFECVYMRKGVRVSLQEMVPIDKDPAEQVARIQQVLAPYVQLGEASQNDLACSTQDSPAVAEFVLRRYGLDPQLDPDYASKLQERYAMSKVEMLLHALRREVELRRIPREELYMYLEIPSHWYAAKHAEEELSFPLVTDCCYDPNILCSDDGNRQQECSNCKFTFNADNFPNDHEAMDWLRKTFDFRL